MYDTYVPERAAIKDTRVASKDALQTDRTPVSAPGWVVMQHTQVTPWVRVAYFAGQKPRDTQWREYWVAGQWVNEVLALGTRRAAWVDVNTAQYSGPEDHRPPPAERWARGRPKPVAWRYRAHVFSRGIIAKAQEVVTGLQA